MLFPMVIGLVGQLVGRRLSVEELNSAATQEVMALHVNHLDKESRRFTFARIIFYVIHDTH